MKDKIKTVRFVIAATNEGWCGYWGVGDTLEKAAINTMKNGAMKRTPAYGWVVFNDEAPFVDDFAFCCWGGKDKQDAFGISIGYLGKVGSLIPKKIK